MSKDPFWEREFIERMVRVFADEPRPFVVIVWENLEGFNKEAYDHTYARLEEIAELMPEETRPSVAGMSPLGPA